MTPCWYSGTMYHIAATSALRNSHWCKHAKHAKRRRLTRWMAQKGAGQADQPHCAHLPP